MAQTEDARLRETTVHCTRVRTNLEWKPQDGVRASQSCVWGGKGRDEGGDGVGPLYHIHRWPPQRSDAACCTACGYSSAATRASKHIFSA